MRRWSLPWPLPAVLAWGLAWAVFRASQHWGVPHIGWSVAAASLVGVLASAWGSTPWRRALIALGFPLSLLAAVLSSGAAVPAWAWLLPLGVLLLLYPLHAWRDAPLYPTPLQALRALPTLAPLPAGARILDAGSGLGDGLRALRRAYPDARLDGVEWSALLRLGGALRCPWARVRQGDLWQLDWSPYAMVYLFQRPESMARAWDKAARELRPGAWLVSLDFAVEMQTPSAHCQAPNGKMVWLYQAPLDRPVGDTHGL